MTTDIPPESVTSLARRLLDSLPAMTEHLVEALLADDPSYVGSATTLDDLRTSCHDNLERLLRNLAGDADADMFEIPRRTGRHRAEQGVPLEALLHAYRLGHRMIWDFYVVQARKDEALEALIESATYVWDVVESFTATVAAAYRETERVLLQRDARRREALVDALLEGRGNEPAVLKDVTGALGLPETGPYAVLVLAGTTAGPAVQDAMSVRGLRSATRQWIDREVLLVSLGQQETKAVVTVVEQLTGVRAGLSPAVKSLAEANVALRLAETALRAMPQGLDGVNELDQRLPAALVATAPDLGARLLDRALGPILALPDYDRQVLLDTLRAWLATGGSAGDTAQRVYCHRNTVLNRLRRIESLTSRSINRADDLAEFALALTAAEVLGDSNHRPTATPKN